MWRKVIFLIPMMIVFYNRFLIWFHSGQIASIWKEIPSYCTVKVVTFAQKKYIEDLNVNNRYNVMHNGNWTEWSAIWAEILCVISKSNERTARVWFEIISMISDQNCTAQGSITTLLHPFWNRPNTGLGQFKYFIDAVLS